MQLLRCATALMVFVTVFFSVAQAQPIVPALIIMGDSIFDAGNNNNLYTLIKANFLPYGRDFASHKPTGRFCNGKLASDFTAESLGFKSYPIPYLSKEANGTKLLTGANFASAASGYYDNTAFLYSAVSLTRQVKYYKEWQSKVVKMVGNETANTTFARAIHLLSAGSSDFIQNYYINPVLNLYYSTDRFSDILIKSYSTFVENMYGLGARKIGVTTLPPMGCLPAAITVYGGGKNQCVQRMNDDSVSFNDKLNSASQALSSQFPDLNLLVFDIYNPLLDLITKPGDHGFFEARKACCGTGTLETSLLCNGRSVGTCSNASSYVFWDGFHPTEAANQVLARDLLVQGISLIS